MFFYQPAAGFTGTDSFTYVISDGRGGTAIGTVLVNLAANPGPSQNTTRLQAEPAPGGGTQMRVSFAGIPGRSYHIQSTDSMTPPITWTARGTVTADARGKLEFVDPPPLPTSRFYRSVSP